MRNINTLGQTVEKSNKEPKHLSTCKLKLTHVNIELSSVVHEITSPHAQDQGPNQESEEIRLQYFPLKHLCRPINGMQRSTLANPRQESDLNIACSQP